MVEKRQNYYYSKNFEKVDIKPVLLAKYMNYVAEYNSIDILNELFTKMNEEK